MDVGQEASSTENAASAEAGFRKPWQQPELRQLDVVLGTETNNGLGSDAGAGSSHS